MLDSPDEHTSLRSENTSSHHCRSLGHYFTFDGILIIISKFLALKGQVCNVVNDVNDVVRN